jgi:hypothetical protein
LHPTFPTLGINALVGRLAVAFALSLSLIAAPAFATSIDLTTVNASGTINGAIYQQISPQPTGTGFVDSFVEIGQPGGKPALAITSAYNTTVDGVLDNGSSDQFNHSITLSDVGIVNFSGTDYREFLLDINESSGQPMGVADAFLSLDEVQIFGGGTASSSVDTLTA